MRPSRARWGGEHFRTPLEPERRFWNTQSCIGHFNGQSVDRYLVRDRDQARSWPSETVYIPEYPMELEDPSPAETAYPWLPFPRFSPEEARFENHLDALNRKFRGGAAARGRRRSTLRLSGMDREDATDYTSLINDEAPVARTNKAHRFGDPEQNKLRDHDSMTRMDSWLNRAAPAAAPADGAAGPPRPDIMDARMRVWLDEHRERIQAQAESKKRRPYKRKSNYGKLADMESDSVMSSYASGSVGVSMTSDATKLPAQLKAEKRRTMAYIGT